MDKILIGLILLVLNQSIHLNGSFYNFILNICGYILIFFGVNELTKEGERFHKIKPYVVIMACYPIFLSAVVFVIHGPGLLVILMGLLSRILYLYILYSVIMGIKDMEDSYDEDMNSDKLYPEWKYLAIFNGLCYLLFIVPVLGYICVLNCLIIQIAFIFSFYKATKMYHQRSFLFKENHEYQNKKEGK